jgi:hypothetical protein
MDEISSAVDRSAGLVEKKCDHDWNTAVEHGVTVFLRDGVYPSELEGRYPRSVGVIAQCTDYPKLDGSFGRSDLKFTVGGKEYRTLAAVPV